MTVAITTKGKPGPKMKTGDRYPSGKLKPAAKASGVPQVRIRRMIELAMHGAADPILATPLGWLRIDMRITDTQVAAGLAYARLRGQYDAAMGLPRRTAASPSYEVGYGARSAEPDPCKAECDYLCRQSCLVQHRLKQSERTCDRHTEMLDAIRLGRRYRDGSRIVRVLDAVCIEHLSAPQWEIPWLITGLDRVADHMNLTIRK